ncbi:Gfo/Idh/MocA family oxidoreductase [Leifsonia kafniensis]|uniref:Gfo/Idh/MocA family oxidoreductase n=1 Tax=Leifsonia kafniensis TaxID=475957 RepID=A0ABP7KPE6_9MICO
MTFPEPRVVPLRGGPTLRWGVVGPGGIATDFVSTLHAHTDQRVTAVGSRTAERAERFAEAHGIPRSYGSYQELVDDPEVDIVYVATPNSQHRPLALLAIAAGKHVLVEKPIGVDRADAQVIVDAARAAGVFAMEAMWSRFLPQTDVIAQLLETGRLGQVSLVTADFGANFGTDQTVSVFRPEDGGGAMRDIGIYPVWFARFVLGHPLEIVARGHLTQSGVDAQVAMIYSAADSAQALLSTTMLADTPAEATISGTLGRIEIRSPFLMPDGFDLVIDEQRQRWTDDSGLRLRDGLCWQATAIAQHVADGLTESPLHTLDDSLAIMGIIDDVRGRVHEAAEAALVGR